MKNHLAYALAVTLVVGVLGCSSEKTTTAQSERVQEQTTYVAEAPPVPPPLTDVTAEPIATDAALNPTVVDGVAATGSEALPTSMISAGGEGNAAAGKTLFVAKCASCHGPDGSASTTMGKNMKIRDLRSAAVQSQTDVQLTDIITNGKSPKSAGPHKSKKLSAEEIRNAVAFIRSIKA